MTADPSGGPGGDDRPGRDGQSGYATRRRFLAVAATAGLGLGSVGGHLPPRGTGGHRPSRTTDGGVQETRFDGRTPASDGRVEHDDESTTDPPGEPILGANLNGRPHRLAEQLDLLDASDTTWVRAFIDVRAKIDSGVPPERDRDVVALRRAALEKNCKLIVSLKWDFRANWGDKPPIRVPSPDSRLDRALRRGAVAYLRGIGVPVDVVVLGNEPMWETLGDDVRGDDPAIVRFTRRVKDDLVESGDHGDPTYLVGAFNRAHDDAIRERHYPDFFRKAFEFVREDEDVDGVDLHVHFDAIDEAERMVAFAREELGDGTIAVTEFSPVWRYDRNVRAPIAASEVGERFARDYGLPDGATAVDYFEYAKRNPRPPEEVAALYEALPWYNVDHVADVHARFADYDVSVATFGFLQGIGMREEDWTANWTPFHINFLYQPALMRADDGVEQTAHTHYLADYRERSTPPERG